jgi:3-methyladenine DNA glycosylase AlkD
VNAVELTQVMRELEGLGTAPCKKTYVNHGAREPLFGVRVGDMKKIVKKTKTDHELALALWETGNADARYLAGLVADAKQMTREQLTHWAETADWSMLSDYAVAGVAAETPFGWDLGLAWIESDRELTASAGWCTLSGVLSTRQDEDLDLPMVRRLLERIARSIHDAPNEVRYSMNGFVIAAGSFVAGLSDEALEIAESVGPVHVDMGNTSCKVPFAPDYIRKVKKLGRIGKKRRTARC